MASPIVDASAPGRGDVLGFDLARMTAMVLVVGRHQLSISGADESIIPPFVGLGIFCVLSGYLSLNSSRRSPKNWLIQRLIKIFIPYMVAAAAIITANYVYEYKPVSPGLVVATLLGIAYYTHPGQLIGVHTWFITLILQCYVASALIRWDRRILPVVAACVFLMSGQDKFSGCRAAYFVGCLAATRPSPWTWLGLALACGGLEYFDLAEFRYASYGAGAMFLASTARSSSPKIMQWARGLSYEVFLIHGAVLLGLSRTLHFPLAANLTLGTAAVVVAALALKRVSRWIMTQLNLEGFLNAGETSTSETRQPKLVPALAENGSAR